MEITLRQEQEQDYKIVENVTREAFWNLHVPGCDEHFLAHNLRKCQNFISELDFVAVINQQIVGNIMYCKSIIKDCDKTTDVITFGPISVLPEFQKQGIGKSLINHTISLAKKMGYSAIFIYGDPEYYKRFGFNSAKKYNITTANGSFHDALMALELKEDVLKNIKGSFFEDEVYHVNQDKLIDFEKLFPPKEKFVTESQIRFSQMSNN